MGASDMNAAELVRAVIREYLEPPRSMRCSDWADEFRYIAKGPERGRWRTGRTPYLQEPMNCTDPEDPCQKVVMQFATQLGKALVLDTPIATPSGWTTMGEIGVGDVVFDQAGKPCNVIGRSPVYTDHACYRVTFSDGAQVVADAGHRWTVDVERDARKIHSATLTTEHIAATFKNGNRNVYAIPVAQPLDLPDAALPIAPYTLGAWLGDGNGQAMEAVTRPTFGARLASLGVLNNKHIPAIYLRASRAQRLTLLHGLMDTDGTVCKTGGRVEISSSYPVLAGGIVELVRSLGFKPTVAIKKTSAKDSTRIGWMAYADQPVFAMPRKLQHQRSREGARVSESTRRRIVAVDQVASVPVRCISVDSASHLYLAGREMVPTHNSEVLYNALFKRIHLDPADMMMVQPTLQDAKDHSRERFMPTARQMPEVNDRLPDRRSRDETNTALTKEIKGGATAFFAGANSARSLASKPLGFVVCDEIDGYPLDVDGEGDPLALVWERMSNFPTRKLLLCSTPTLRDFSRIEGEFLASDRRRYWVPCPHCGDMQILVWGADAEHGIKWLKTAAGEPRAETAVYVCAHCGASIEERNKTRMLNDGQWRPDMPGAQRGLVAGFQLNKLYSPNGWKSWAMLVEDWTKAQHAARSGDTSRLKTFINTSLAETWEAQGDRIASHELQRRAPDIPVGIVTWGMLVRTLGVDVQGDRLEVFDWAWGRGMQSQLVEHRVFYGDPSIIESEASSPWAQLTEYRRTAVFHASGRQSPLFACFVDSGGHHTQQVYVYARAHQQEHVHAIKGASIAGRAILGKPSDQDIDYRGQKIKRGVRLWPIGTDTAKGLIYGRLRLSEPGPGFVHISRNMPGEIFEQLTAERLVTRFVKGHSRLEWVKPNGKRNEALDGAVYALAAAHYRGIDRWKDGEWTKWEARVQAPLDVIEAAPSDGVIRAAPVPSPGRISLGSSKRFASSGQKAP